MAKWKAESLNKAGRVVLLKSSLDSLPTYWFSLFKLPVGVSKNIDGIRRKFFWVVLVIKRRLKGNCTWLDGINLLVRMIKVG